MRQIALPISTTKKTNKQRLLFSSSHSANSSLLTQACARISVLFGVKRMGVCWLFVGFWGAIVSYFSMEKAGVRGGVGWGRVESELRFFACHRGRCTEALHGVENCRVQLLDHGKINN